MHKSHVNELHAERRAGTDRSLLIPAENVFSEFGVNENKQTKKSHHVRIILVINTGEIPTTKLDWRCAGDVVKTISPPIIISYFP